MTHHTFYTKGVCSRCIDFDLDEENRLHNISYTGGCNGNLQAVGRLCEGMPAQEAVDKLLGIRCDEKPTSCGDQLARCLRKILGA